VQKTNKGMKIKIILVQPEYPENLGLTARAMKNFGFKELFLVNPKAGKGEARAKSRAAHAIDVLEKARVFKSLAKALEQVDYSVATTAKPASGKKLFRTAISPKNLAAKFSKTNAVLGIVFGRESSGLTNNEIKQCDFVASIPSSVHYHTLNISHAAAIMLYEFFSTQKGIGFKAASRETKKILLKKISGIVGNSATIQNKDSVILSFKALVSRALVTEKEAKAMLTLLSEMERKG